MTPASSGPGPTPKVPRVIEEYGLDGLEDELEDKWTRSEDRYSLRALAELFNKRLVAAALESASVETLTDDSSSVYAVLSGDRGSSGQQTQLVRRLERNGVDAEALLDDFVTYQSVRSYLKTHRDVLPPTTDNSDARASAAETVEGLRERTVTVTESKVDQLESAGQLTLGSRRVHVDIRIFCEDCTKQYDASDLLKAGSCECEREISNPSK